MMKPAREHRFKLNEYSPFSSTYERTGGALGLGVKKAVFLHNTHIKAPEATVGVIVSVTLLSSKTFDVCVLKVYLSGLITIFLFLFTLLIRNGGRRIK